jgi:uncharacterized protein YecT (DUF1311 family)
MENNRKVLIGILTVVVVILAACGNSSEESSIDLGKQSKGNHSSQNTNEDSFETDSSGNISNTDNHEANETVDKSSNLPTKEEDPSTDNTEENLKDVYIKRLVNTKKEAEELEAVDSSTYALKKVENDRWEIWDKLLNEMYGVLKVTLTPEEMDTLRAEQRKWIEFRDDRALQASLKYKGGTQELLEYVAVLAILTEERCYELVEDYMK